MIELEKKELKNYSYNQRKRENQKKFNILNIDKILNLEFKINEKLMKRYSKYDKELENIKIFSNDELELYKIELENSIFYIRDRIELSFFFNKYFSIEYLDEKSKYKKFLDFHKSKDFYMIKEYENIFILDYKSDLIKK